MGDVDVDEQIYDVVRPLQPPSWSAGKLSRPKTIGPTAAKCNGNYSVPRALNPATPPPPKPIPPTVPPRNRYGSEGEPYPLHMFSHSASPVDRPLTSFMRNGVFPGRVRTISTPAINEQPPMSLLSKSPSILSVSSQHSGVEELSLADFMAKYSKSLPLRVKVCKGFFGVSEKTAITMGDVFNLHFVKNTKVVAVETVEGTQLSVPLNSSLTFGVIYDPNEKEEEARGGIKFETVGDMLSMRSLPKVVRATRAHVTSSAETSVAEGELLVIKSTRSKLTGKKLTAYSVTSSKKKSLNENCAAHFSTAPSDTAMYLYEMAMHLRDIFPSRAQVFLHENHPSDSVLKDLCAIPLMMKSLVTDSSVIATSALDEDVTSTEVAEMPVQLDIEVEPVALDDDEIDHLRQDTKFMFENFKPFTATLYMTKPTKRLYDVQCQLFQTVIAGSELRGLDVIRPLAIHHTSQPPSQPPPLRSKSLPEHSSASDVYQPLDLDTRENRCLDYYVMMTPRSVSAEQTDSDVSGESHTSDHLSFLETHIKFLEKRLVESSEDIRKMASTIEHLGKRCDSLQSQIRMAYSTDNVDNRPPAPLPTAPPPDEAYMVVGSSPTPSESSPAPSDNATFLASMTITQVQSLLGAMGFKQYQESFLKESINGEFLSECDEEVLSCDLGVSSKLHRMKLLKVISGRHSAQRILAGEDPYTDRR